MTAVGSAYGEALYDLCKAEGLSEEILTQLSALDESFSQEPDFLRLLGSPSLSKWERCDILEQSFRGKVHDYVLNFLKILTEKDYIHHFPQCRQAYLRHYDLDNNILPVQVSSAVPLSADQMTRLTDKLGSLTGKTIRLTNRLDETCLGGIRLDYDGKQVDDTLAHRLDTLRKLLRSTVL